MKKVLIVEDELIVAKDIQIIVQGLGYDADITSSGEEAIKYVEDTKPDLILMDIKLSGYLSGIDTAIKIREHFDMPIIYLTAYADEDTLQRTKKTEPYGYIIKPFDEQEIRINLKMAFYKHKMERKLKESEEKYRTLINNLNDVVAEIDDQGIITYIGPQILEMNHYPPEDIIGTSFFQYIHPDDQDSMMALFHEDNIKSGNTISVDYRGKKKDGGHIDLSARGTFIEKEGGIKLVLLVRDISERKKAKQDLMESEEKYRQLFENTPFSILLIDKSGRIIDVNPAIEKLMGFKRDELIGKKYKKLLIVHPRHLPILLNRLRTVSKLEEQPFIDVELYKKDGSLIWVSLKSNIIKLGEKTVIQVIGDDISERKKAEQDLKESEEKYRSILENMKESYFEVDLKGNFLFCNDAFCNSLGYSRNEIQGRNFKELLDDENFKTVFSYYNQVYKTGDEKLNSEYEVYTKTGKKINVESSAYLKYDSEGEKIGFYGIARDVTERKKAEMEIKASEERYRNMIRNLDLGFYHINWEGIILNHNPAFNKIFNIDPLEDLVGKSVENYWKYKEGRMVYVKKMLKDGVIKNYISQINDKNGNIIIFQLNSHLLKDAQGNPIAIEGTISDITEKFMLELKLKDSERQHRITLDSLGDPMHVVDEDLRIVLINETFRQWVKKLGLSRILIGQTIFETFPFLHDDLREEYKHVFETGKILNTEEDIIINDKLVITETRKIPIFSEGKVTQVITILRDTTEQKNAKRKIKESEEKFRQIFDSIPDLFFLVSDDSTILDYRGKSKDLYVTQEVFLNRRLVEILPKEIGDLSYNAIKQAIISKEPQVVEYSLPINEEIRYFEARHLFFSQNLVAIFVRDVTKRKEAALLIQEEVEKLKQLDQIRKDLISRVSHELKTPLIPVLGGAELLLYAYSDQLNEETQDIVRMMEKGGKRLQELVNRLLDISRIDYNKLILERERFDLGELIREASKDVRYSLEKRKINLKLDLQTELIADVDVVRIAQVITNLLSNAIKNTPPNGNINVNLEKYDNWAILTVTDTGVGLTEKEIKVIFTRFGKIERYGAGLEYVNIQGTGLGLYISKQIVELHGGKIWVESEGRHKGAIFKVRLPV